MDQSDAVDDDPATGWTDPVGLTTDGPTSWGRTWTFAYDANGNRTQATHNGTTVSALTFDGGNDISTSGYNYDAAGNLTHTPGAVSLSYNGSDQLTGRSGGATGSYTYAGSNQTELVSQTVPSGGTYSYAYGRSDRNGLPVLDTFSNANGTSYLTHDADGNPLALKTYQGKYTYYVTDGLGSPIALINPSGAVVATYTYDPYGAVTVNNITGNTAATLNPYRYAGGLLDRTTDYVKFGQRYYDPITGRFTQQDSVEVIGNPGRGNRYEYAADNPTNYLDPTGESFFSSIGSAFSSAFSTLKCVAEAFIPSVGGGDFVLGGLSGIGVGVASAASGVELGGLAATVGIISGAAPIVVGAGLVGAGIYEITQEC